ncbi:response regulator [Chitinophaga lutea]|uniref:Response regulator n=1 Tax=Chitinophaga lutea TaxID=2488634 RepID=A0A3N4QDZ4_9BACT|nr:response regulator [Chitinophaga lutea]RPE14177.1 response regulator [Chitinophaga lutea]
MTTTPSILLIEDDIDDQEIFTSALAFIDNGIVCSVAANGYEAIMHLNNAATLPDLIFLDLNMPMMNGSQFLREVKAGHKAKDVPVIVFSTASDMKTIQESRQLGAEQFITKPEKFSELVGMLHGLLFPATR